MMLAGRVKVTVAWLPDSHITVLFKAFADNRKRQFKEESNQNWVACSLEDSTHLFCEVPNSSGWNDKIGTFYPKAGRWYDADNADEQRIYAAKMVAHWLTGNMTPLDKETFTFLAAEECYVCGIELTHPDSIARGIGPDCAKKGYESIHQVKTPGPALDLVVSDDALHAATDTQEETWDDLGITDAGMNALVGMIRGASEDQLLDLKEVVDTRLEEVMDMRRTMVAEAREERGKLSSGSQSAPGVGLTTEQSGEVKQRRTSPGVDRTFMGR
jgi:Family of unknown function (DUF6011)